VDQAAGIAVRTVKEFLTEHPAAFDEILWVLFDGRTKAAYDKALSQR
jgi:O-acetyl-ADP-ribose deacetylase (regulator of RNase III)